MLFTLSGIIAMADCCILLHEVDNIVRVKYLLSHFCMTDNDDISCSVCSLHTQH